MKMALLLLTATALNATTQAPRIEDDLTVSTLKKIERSCDITVTQGPSVYEYTPSEETAEAIGEAIGAAADYFSNLPAESAEPPAYDSEEIWGTPEAPPAYEEPPSYNSIWESPPSYDEALRRDPPPPYSLDDFVDE